MVVKSEWKQMPINTEMGDSIIVQPHGPLYLLY